MSLAHSKSEHQSIVLILWEEKRSQFHPLYISFHKKPLIGAIGAFLNRARYGHPQIFNTCIVGLELRGTYVQYCTLCTYNKHLVQKAGIVFYAFLQLDAIIIALAPALLAISLEALFSLYI